MEINLNRCDYFQVGSTNQKTMRLFPFGSKEAGTQQKIAIGDNNGVLQFLSVRKREASSIFKTISGTKISRVDLGGPPGSPLDRVFIAQGSEVKAFNKKGKQFLTFDTSMTESIKAMCVHGQDLLASGSYVYNHYVDLKDTDYFLCSDQINDIAVLVQGKEVAAILGCQDRVLKFLKGCDILFEVEVPGPPAVLGLKNHDGGEEHDEIVYGTTDGKMGAVKLLGKHPTHKWEMANGKRVGGVLCFDFFDMTRDGVPNLVVGRDDGCVELYSFNDSDVPTLRSSHSFSESVTSIQGGNVASPQYDELVAATYAGWIVGLTTEQLSKGMGNTQQQASIDQETQTKIVHMRKEISELQEKVLLERDKYQNLTKSRDDKHVSAVPTFNVNDKFQLSRDDASYTLSIEVQASIDIVLLQSDTPVDLGDVERTSAVISYSECNPETDGNFLVATYRCQANTTRLEVKIRSIEGQAGTIQAYIMPSVKPKTCLVRQYPIRPLSLHQRSHTWDEKRPMNSLRLSGQFSLAEMHSWIFHCLPEVAERTPASESVEMTFVSTFLDTQLECKYSAGLAVFRSENISTISILKDVLSKKATERKIQLDISYELSDESVRSTLRLLHPKMEYQLLLAKKVQLIDALKELRAHEPDMAFLTPEYKDILDNADKYQAEFKRQPCHLERLYGMITDLFIDTFKFRGQNVKGRVPQLLHTLDQYDLQRVLHFFEAAE